MKEMFCYCFSLVKLDLSSFGTLNVTSMGCMFFDCTNLVKLDLSSFDTQNVTSMYYMFYECKSLVKVIRKNFMKVKISNRDLGGSKFAIIEI